MKHESLTQNEIDDVRERSALSNYMDFTMVADTIESYRDKIFCIFNGFGLSAHGIYQLTPREVWDLAHLIMLIDLCPTENKTDILN